MPSPTFISEYIFFVILPSTVVFKSNVVSNVLFFKHTPSCSQIVNLDSARINKEIYVLTMMTGHNSEILL